MQATATQVMLLGLQSGSESSASIHASLCLLQAAAKAGNHRLLLQTLQQVLQGIRGMNEIKMKMHHYCSPRAYYSHVQRPLQGWPDEGMLFQGQLNPAKQQQPSIGL